MLIPNSLCAEFNRKTMAKSTKSSTARTNTKMRVRLAAPATRKHKPMAPSTRMPSTMIGKSRHQLLSHRHPAPHQQLRQQLPALYWPAPHHNALPPRHPNSCTSGHKPLPTPACSCWRCMRVSSRSSRMPRSCAPLMWRQHQPKIAALHLVSPRHPYPTPHSLRVDPNLRPRPSRPSTPRFLVSYQIRCRI